jgi:xanthine dehydrogenase small subunit
VKELGIIEETENSIKIGAAVTYTAVLPAIERLFPSFANVIRRIGSKQIRNLGTIGGNIGTASPIGDTLPCLIALEAKLTLVSLNEARELKIEEFFKEYRKTSLRQGEVIHSITIPKLASDQIFRSYKIAKRYDQDISTVIGAFRLELSDQNIKDPRIAFGGMGPVPARSPTAEKFLKDQAWNRGSLVTAGYKTGEDFTPISDHRGTREYRLKLASNLFQRLYWDVSAPNTDFYLFKL